MYAPVYTKRFAKDLKLAHRRGKNLDKFKIVARTLLTGAPLDPVHRDHRLTGNWLGRRDCHLESDWILIYKIDAQRLIFERMGTHSDVFKKWGSLPTAARTVSRQAGRRRTSLRP